MGNKNKEIILALTGIIIMPVIIFIIINTVMKTDKVSVVEGREICSHDFLYIAVLNTGMAPIFDKKTGLPKRCKNSVKK